MPKTKRPKLSPEERKAARAEKKRQKKLRKAERKRQLKRDHLEREVKYGALTIRRYEKDWRAMLIKVTLPRMREELEFAWHNFERVVDSKDFTISLLMDELKECEEQYMLNFRTHYENLELLMDMFRDRLEELRKDFENEIGKLRDCSDGEVHAIKDTANENEEYLKTMLYRLEMERKEQERRMRTDYYSKLDEADVNYQLSIQKLSAALETKYQSIFNNTMGFINDYNKHIRERKKEHKALKDQDDAMQELIYQQFCKIKHLSSVIRQLKQTFADLKQTEGSKVLDLEAEKQYFRNTFQTLKKKMDSDRKQDFDKMVLLSNCCLGVFDCLEELIKKGENLLTFGAMCRKLETQREKILPFPSTKTKLLPEERTKFREYEEDCESPPNKLDLFWQRFGQSSSIHYAVKREKQFLVDENALLGEAYREYEDDRKCKVMNTRKVYAGAIPHVDANEEIKKYEVYQKGALH